MINLDLKSVFKNKKCSICHSKLDFDRHNQYVCSMHSCYMKNYFTIETMDSKPLCIGLSLKDYRIFSFEDKFQIRKFCDKIPDPILNVKLTSFHSTNELIEFIDKTYKDYIILK